MKKILVFASGSGTTFNEIINQCNNNVIRNCQVIGLIYNKNNENLVNIAINHNINKYYLPYKRKEITRSDYDYKLINLVKTINHDFIVLAGWMHILSADFLKSFPKTINLHPALPNTFIGADCIKDAYDHFKKTGESKAGSMVHITTPKLDRGDVIGSVEVPIYNDDTIEILRNRVKYFEKSLIVSSINRYIDKYITIQKPFYVGKVRDMYDIGYNKLSIVHSNRLSSFDRYIVDVPKKGSILTSISSFWFEKTKHIIKNHMLYAADNVMIVEKCTPFKVEVIVRGYMAGNTSTSLWTHYSNGKRNYCGNIFRDGYKLYEKLDSNVVTPTTKGETDELISGDEIISRGLMTNNEWCYIKDKSLELFNYGQELSLKSGLILVDTKYEFGKNSKGEIMIIDELHTCDSSRFWLSDTYYEKIINNLSPDKFDKDIVRDWVKKVCDPYKDEIPEIPNSLIENTMQTYNTFYNMISGNKKDFYSYCHDKDFIKKDYFENYSEKMCIIISNSVSNLVYVNKITKALKDYDIYSLDKYFIYNKDNNDILDLINENENSKRDIVYIIIDKNNLMSSFISYNTKFPVFSYPPIDNKFDMIINSTVNCADNAPVITVFEPKNLALIINKILAN